MVAELATRFVILEFHFFNLKFSVILVKSILAIKSMNGVKQHLKVRDGKYFGERIDYVY